MEYHFSDLFSWTSGKPITPTIGNVPVYGSNGVIGYTEKAKYHNKIILGRVGAFCGSVEYCPSDFDATDNTLITTCDTTKILYGYAYYLLKQFSLNKYAGGAAQPLITQGLLKHLKCDIPTINEQQQIVSILSAYDSLIEINNKRIKVLEQMAENLYKEWFIRFRFPGHETAEFENGIPKGWEEQKLEQFGIRLDSGSRPSGGVDDSIKEGIPSLGAEAVNRLGEFDYCNVKLIPLDYYNQMKHGKNTERDILVYKDGAYIGKTTIFMNGFPYSAYAVNEHVFLLNAMDKNYQLYLYFTLHRPEYYALMQNLNRNAAQPGLSKPDMNRIKVMVPKKGTVRAFNAIIEPILKQVFSMASQNRIVIKQRDLLLPRLMSGKLEV